MDRIILADNQTMFRIGVGQVLAMRNHSWMIVQCSNRSQLYAAIATCHKALVIVSCSLRPDFSQVFAGAHAGSSQVLAIAEADAAPPSAVASELGGLIYRNASVSSLIDCVRRVLRGERVIQPPQEYDSTAPLDFAGTRVRDCLIPREMKVVALILEGCKNREIGLRLGTTEQAIKNDLLRIYDKTGVSDRVQLALFALNHRALTEAAVEAGNLLIKRPPKLVVPPSELLGTPNSLP